jgi:GAF domain-containing protein
MPYVTCSACGLSTYLVSRGECPGCGEVLLGREGHHAPLKGSDPAGAIHGTLRLAHAELGVDKVVISQIAAGRETIRWAVGNETFPAFAPGASLPLEDTICRHLLDGRIGALVPDVQQDPVLAELPLVRASGVRTYLGVPMNGADAQLYVLCCLAREARPDLGEADVRFLTGLTESLALSSPFAA